MRRAALLAPLVVLLLAGSSGAGSYYGPHGDTEPQWSPNGTQVVYSSVRSGVDTVGAAGANGQDDRLIPGIPVGPRSPNWKYVSFVKEIGTETWTVVSKVDGSDEHRIGENLGPITWSPDSSRIAFSSDSDGLVVSDPDGSGRRVVVSGPAYLPAWSPDGRYFAYFRDGIHVVSATGANDTEISPLRLGAPIQQPVWSPDSTRVAYRGPDSSTVVAVSQLDGVTRTYAVKNGPGQIVWAASGALLVQNRDGYVLVDITTGKQRQVLDDRKPSFLLPSFRDVAVSRDGSEIAYSSGGECRDRLGIYVAKLDGSDARRISNSCRIVGTDGPDIIHADWSRVVLGLGGDDALYADDTAYYFEANTLYGGPGDDTLVGGNGDDALHGGPGDDTISGGPGYDVIVGGPGHDHIDAGRGGDTIYARDGEKDWIDCGKPGYSKRDVVYADAVDVVAADCKVVHRG